MSMRRIFPRTLVAAAAAALVATGAAVAATLGVTSQRLTSWSAASAVPVSTCTLTPSADSWVNQATLQQGVNHGGDGTLQVESSRTLTLISTNKRAFVKFDIGSCSIPAGASVQAATLSVVLSSAPSLGRTWNVDRVTGAWAEGGITWSNQPGATASTSVSTGTASGATLQANVISDVQAFLSGTANNGWRFSDSLESSPTSFNGAFNSREAGSDRPSLVISYYP